MGNIEDITDGIPAESPEPVPAPPVEAPVEEVQPETIPYRGRDGDFQLPAAEAAAVAAAMGFDNPAALVNKLRMADEADAIYRESREALRKAHQARQQPAPDAYYQQQEAQRQYRQPQRPQYQPQAPEQDDPLALIRAMSERLAEVDQRTAAVSEYVEWQRQEAIRSFQERQRGLEREVRTEYGKLADDLRKKGTPDWKIPDMESLLSEAESMGMFGGTLPPGDIVRRTYRMLYGDEIAQEAVKAQMNRLADKKVRVAVPASPSASPPPLRPPDPNSIAGMEAAIQGLHFRDVDLPPERR